MIISIPAVALYHRPRPSHRIMFVKYHEAKNDINHLARDGFLNHVFDRRASKILPPTIPDYTMKFVAGGMMLYQDLGWMPPYGTSFPTMGKRK